MLANFFDGLTDLVYIADLETHDFSTPMPPAVSVSG